MLDPLPSCAKGIIIDGVGLHSVNRADVRDRIIAMSQDPVFLPGRISLKRQFDPLDSSTPEECYAVLQLVELGNMASNVADMETPLRLESLSGGQRQLFNLPHMVLRGRVRSRRRNGGSKSGALLLLDEVTASISMDHQIERIMQRVIKGKSRSILSLW